ncbi:hypothetical protein B484DRAFT_400683 [Ochromonadaceae sp. CCMP2298]|nr:hypothetical protein B484DRAFT_400683 [Ochromonadaceae sp. CCMP2298]
MAYHSSLSSLYAVGDARRFSMGTPEDVESTMTRCWEVAPCSARIVEDFADYPRVLMKSQRKATMHAQPMHADCLGALDLIRGHTQMAAMGALVEEMEEMVEQADEQSVEEQQDDEEGAEQDDLVEKALDPS